MDLYGTFANQGPAQPQVSQQPQQGQWGGYNNDELEKINEKIKWLNQAAMSAPDNPYLQKTLLAQYETLIEPILQPRDETENIENSLNYAEGMFLMGKEAGDEQMMLDGLTMYKEAINKQRGLPTDYGFEEAPTNETPYEKFLRENNLNTATGSRRGELETLFASGDSKIKPEWIEEYNYLAENNLDELPEDKRLIKDNNKWVVKDYTRGSGMNGVGIWDAISRMTKPRVYDPKQNIGTNPTRDLL